MSSNRASTRSREVALRWGEAEEVGQPQPVGREPGHRGLHRVAALRGDAILPRRVPLAHRGEHRGVGDERRQQPGLLGLGAVGARARSPPRSPARRRRCPPWNSSSQRSTRPSSRARLEAKWYSRPPLDTRASAATASSVSACAPSRRITALAASSSFARGSPRGLVRSGQVEPHDADDDEREAPELQCRRRLAEGEHAERGDQGGAGRRPDRVGGADGSCLSTSARSQNDSRSRARRSRSGRAVKPSE